MQVLSCPFPLKGGTVTCDHHRCAPYQAPLLGMSFSPQISSYAIEWTAYLASKWWLGIVVYCLRPLQLGLLLCDAGGLLFLAADTKMSHHLGSYCRGSVIRNATPRMLCFAQVRPHKDEGGAALGGSSCTKGSPRETSSVVPAPIQTQRGPCLKCGVENITSACRLHCKRSAAVDGQPSRPPSVVGRSVMSKGNQ